MMPGSCLADCKVIGRFCDRLILDNGLRLRNFEIFVGRRQIRNCGVCRDNWLNCRGLRGWHGDVCNGFGDFCVNGG